MKNRLFPWLTSVLLLLFCTTACNDGGPTDDNGQDGTVAGGKADIMVTVGNTDPCPAVYAPVCGADGRTYSNACKADRVGVPVLFDGPCEVETEDDSDDQLDERDPETVDTMASECVEGLLYATDCGSDNCEQPIGPCPEELVELDRIVDAFYRRLQEEGEILSNGYYTSAVTVSPDQRIQWPAALDKERLLEGLGDILLTEIYHVNLSDAMRNALARELYGALMATPFASELRFYTKSQLALPTADLVHLVLASSCDVAGPEDRLVVTIAGQDNAYLSLRSDVCD